MKPRLLLPFILFSLALPLVRADQGVNDSPAPKPAADDNGPLLPIQDYDGTVARFRNDYQKAGKPRLLVYVNRSLVTNRGEMLASTETESSTKTKGDTVPLPNGTNIQVGNDNKAQGSGGGNITGQGGERNEDSTVKVRTNMERDLGVAPITESEAREIEEVLQRPLFDAGSKIVDQKVAQAGLRKFAEAGGNFLTPPKTDKEREEIETLQKSTDIVIEILARKKTVLIPMPSGDDQRQERLTLTLTATHLKDGVKVAQVNSDSLFGFNRRFGDRKERRYKQVTSAEIIEQCALALMQRVNF